jgi:MoaA/NifB/PqqE/SkfB family radical SAM enzyme
VVVNNELYYKNWLSRGSVNLDISNKCTLDCPRCARRKFKSKKDIPGHIMTNKEWEIYLNHFNNFIFSGQFSDPILHPNFPNMLKDISNYNKSASIHTAASHKSKDFFIECFQSLENSHWIFGIDGLPENSCKYRINQDGTKLFDMMVLSKAYVKQTTWQFIIFKYNESEIDEAKKLAGRYDLDIKFLMSSRFTENDPYKPSDKFFIKRDEGYAA